MTGRGLMGKIPSGGAKALMAVIVACVLYLLGMGAITIVQFFIWAFGRLPR